MRGKAMASRREVVTSGRRVAVGLNGEPQGEPQRMGCLELGRGDGVGWQQKHDLAEVKGDSRRGKKCDFGDAARRGWCRGCGRRANRVEHEVCDDWRWLPMVCEGTWRFLGCARSLVDDGSGEDTTDKIERDGWCRVGAPAHGTFQHSPCAGRVLGLRLQEKVCA